jgi:hypothetical protein
MIVYIVFLNFVVPSPPKTSDVASSSSSDDSDDGVDDDDEFESPRPGNNLKF